MNSDGSNQNVMIIIPEANVYAKASAFAGPARNDVQEITIMCDNSNDAKSISSRIGLDNSYMQRFDHRGNRIYVNLHGVYVTAHGGPTVRFQMSRGSKTIRDNELKKLLIQIAKIS
jgi:hypothetical protein